MLPLGCCARSISGLINAAFSALNGRIRLLDFLYGIVRQNSNQDPHPMDTKLKGTIRAARLVTRLKRFSYLSILVVIAIGVLALVGWLVDLDFAKRPIPGLVAMNPATAICFILLAVSLRIITAKDIASKTRIIGYSISALVILIALLVLLDGILNLDWGVDTILFEEGIKADRVANISSRMAPNTALSFILSGSILLLIRMEGKWVIVFQSLALVIGLVGLLSILGYVYRVQEFYGALAYLPMAVHTAICFYLFAAAILFESAGIGIMKELTSPYSGGLIGRLLIPVAMLIPICLGYLQLFAKWNFGFSDEFGGAVLILSIIVVFVAIIWFVVFTLNEKDRLREAAEEQVKLAYTLLKSSIESYNDVMIFSVDRKYHYLNFNKAFKTATAHAYGTEVITGMSMLDSITLGKDRKKAKANCDKALAGESHSTVEIYGTLNLSYYETRYDPITDQNGEIIGVTVLSANVTERMQAEEQMKAMNKELEAFSYSVAHDLRAPLRIINGYAGILVEDYASQLNEECIRLLQVISGNARKMGQLIDGLLNFSRMSRLRVNKSVVNMQQLVRAVVDEQVKTAEKVGIEVKLGKLEKASCDSGLMRHILSNLVSNAIKYSRKREKPKIEINSYKGENEVVYYVRDNGAGFDMKYQDKLFGVFQRLHGEKEFEGTGVGLAIVHRIITRHGGRVWAEAEIDKGATFYFSLPSRSSA